VGVLSPLNLHAHMQSRLGVMSKLKSIESRIHNWWLGKWVGLSDKDGIFISGHLERPWLAKAFDYIRREYKWLIGVLLVLLGLYIAYIRQ
jgi:hypothetical protein